MAYTYADAHAATTNRIYGSPQISSVAAPSAPFLTGQSGTLPQQGNDILTMLTQALHGMGGNMQGAQSTLNSLTTNPAGSPLFQAQVGPLLQSLMPQAQLAQQNLTDMFRQAGNMSSGAFGNQASKLQGDIYNRNAQAVAGLLGQIFPQLLQTAGLQEKFAMDPINALVSALGNVHPLSQTFGFGPSGGGGGGGGGGGSEFGFSPETMAAEAANAYKGTPVGYGSQNPNNMAIDAYLKALGLGSNMPLSNGVTPAANDYGNQTINYAMSDPWGAYNTGFMGE